MYLSSVLKSIGIVAVVVAMSGCVVDDVTVTAGALVYPIAYCKELGGLNHVRVTNSGVYHFECNNGFSKRRPYDQVLEEGHVWNSPIPDGSPKQNSKRGV